VCWKTGLNGSKRQMNKPTLGCVKDCGNLGEYGGVGSGKVTGQAVLAKLLTSTCNSNEHMLRQQ